MNVSISISPSSIKLGDTVTVTYSSIGFRTTSIILDNLANPLVFNGDASGSFKTIPLIDGAFNAVIQGAGRAVFDTSDTGVLENNASCEVK